MSRHPAYKVAFEELVKVARTEPKLRAVVVAPKPTDAFNLYEEFGSIYGREFTGFAPERVAILFSGAKIFFKSMEKEGRFAGSQYGYVLKVFPTDLLTLIDNMMDLQLGLRLDPQTTKTAVL